MVCKMQEQTAPLDWHRAEGFYSIATAQCLVLALSNDLECFADNVTSTTWYRFCTKWDWCIFVACSVV
eukprot:m.13248 g.13248  ORF g.13248 m.13248 type:complete len:68 (-) comp10075_c0_seq1:3531-3734(-)